ncbi:acyl-ACP thioesterase domain-containing protein [Mariniflexile litorale]|uniref:Acyl-ACP thioesterase domain-containing protein n=1 Tax=Mariniflexile litorale TaxID=3045158 RepID=A0AAU7EAJ1_9FLAO|nr:acyl-ACP thioesterase domain-containing protein [Mariniflexile sp. KMM 9835]MDQ8210494.1 thioesterase [Mariniflexile sp. KMM 9835]
MKFENYFDKQFELRYFETNKLGLATPIIILALLEETAADHCYSINHSLFDLLKKNVGWVLVSGVLKMDRYPNYKEKITIRTWLSSYTSIKGYRENIIFDEQQNIIGSAKGLWVFFDIEKRKPLPIFNDMKEKWSFFGEESIIKNIKKKIDALDVADHIKKFKVHRFDIDSNKHVNNIKYLQWVIESIPEDIVDHYYLHEIDGRFISEAQYGDHVLSLTNKNGIDYSFQHTIKVEGSNKVCATANTVWKKF